MTCRLCGTALSGHETECPLCGAPVDRSARADPGTGSSDGGASGHGSPGRPVAPVTTSGHRRVAVPVVAALACLAVAVVGGGAVLFFRHAGSDGGTAAPTVGTVTVTQSADGPASSVAGETTGPGSETSPVSEAPGGQAPPTDEPSGEPTDEPTTVGIVELHGDLARSSAGQEVATTLSELFSDIEARRYDDAYAHYTRAMRSRLGSVDTWAAGYRSTSYDSVDLDRLTGVADGGAVTAHVRFRSRQDPSQAPDRLSTCLDWTVSYRLVPAGGSVPYLVDRVRPDVPPGARAYEPCD